MSKQEKFTISILLPASCALGSLCALAGGIFLSLGGLVVVVVATVLWMLLGKKEKKSPELPAETVVVPIREIEIPPDRTDPLTGLANENGLNAWFSEKAERFTRDNKGIIVLSADLAEFEQLERSRGKKIADAVLIEVAGRVQTCTGDDGIAARTSGDEFAAIASVVPDHSSEIAEAYAGKLADLIQRPVELASGVVWIGGSVGAAYGKISEGTLVLENARKALVEAKRLGRGHYVVYKNDQSQ